MDHKPIIMLWIPLFEEMLRPEFKRMEQELLELVVENASLSASIHFSKTSMIGNCVSLVTPPPNLICVLKTARLLYDAFMHCTLVLLLSNFLVEDFLYRCHKLSYQDGLHRLGAIALSSMLRLYCLMFQTDHSSSFCETSSS